MATEDTGNTDEKGLDYYLAHPEEVDPTNTELVQKLLATSGETEGTSKAAEPPKTEEKPNPETDPDAVAAAAAKAKEAGDGGKETKLEEGDVLAADGKSVIPFSVLKQARETGAAAEAALREANDANLALTDRLKALQDGKAPPVDDKAPKTAEELQASIEEIRDQAPWLVPTLEKLVQAQRDLEEKLAKASEQIEQSEGDREAALQRQAAELQARANTALEGNATLLLWKTERPDLYKEAVQQDVLLRRDPEAAKRFVDDQGQPNFTTRFERCVRMVKAAHEGEDIPLPKPVVAKAPAPAPDPAKTQQVAKEKLAQVSQPEVTTLTDVPGGKPAAQTEEEAIETESVTALGSRLMSMTPDQRASWLARNG